MEELQDATDNEDLAAGPGLIGLEHARALVRQFAEVTTSKDVDALLAGFPDGCIVQYGAFPVMRGKEALRPFVKEMFSPRLRDFICEKTLRTLSGNVIGGTWTATWTDAKSGKPRSGRGLEFWTMRGDQIARWDANFASWDAETERSQP
jgi:ketosteroid isomerase-like protein